MGVSLAETMIERPNSKFLIVCTLRFRMLNPMAEVLSLTGNLGSDMNIVVNLFMTEEMTPLRCTSRMVSLKQGLTMRLC